MCLSGVSIGNVLLVNNKYPCGKVIITNGLVRVNIKANKKLTWYAYGESGDIPHRRVSYVLLLYLFSGISKGRSYGENALYLKEGIYGDIRLSSYTPCKPNRNRRFCPNRPQSRKSGLHRRCRVSI